MGFFSEYIKKNYTWEELEKERKHQLRTISEIRGKREILTYACAMTKRAPIAIDFNDRLPILDQISNLKGDKIDIILETPGGSGEIAEDIIRQVRGRFSEVGMIIPGHAKSAGTIMVMAGDEILMDSASALGPIDAQVFQEGKNFSAHAFLEGLKKIKEEVEATGKLNRAYVPILQNISPGEIQSCINVMSFSEKLVTDWLAQYKFKFWEKHSSNGKQVTQDEKTERAKEIAKTLCDHGKWLTHGRSITIQDLREMRLKITDFSENPHLYEAIRRYYTLLLMSFDRSPIFKIFETPQSQMYRSTGKPEKEGSGKALAVATIEVKCPNCNIISRVQANLEEGAPLEPGATKFPKDNVLLCPACKHKMNLEGMRKKIELDTGKKIL